MRDYGKVSPQFWTGTTGRRIRALGANAQVVALYLMTCPASSMIGLYYLPLPMLAHETGIPLEGACKALRSLGEIGFAEYDEENEIVLVFAMARHQIGERIVKADKRHLGVTREAQKLTYSSLFAKWYARYREPYDLPSMASTASPLEAPSKPLRSQEQEHGQEHAQEQPSSPAAVAPLALAAQATVDPAPTKPAKTPRAKKPAADPPPFSVADALDALASTAGRRFVVGDKATWAGGWVIALQKLARQFPDLSDWRLVGAWLAAGFGGGLPTAAFGVRWAASGALPDAVAKARAWDADGRPAAFDERGFPVRATVEAPDPWAAAMRKAGVQ
jgi:hypothetical protein